MVRTRVGYAGGEKENPTYHSLGNHTETLQLDFDPEMISYKELLAIFWDSHDPFMQKSSRQYMSVIFFHSAKQELVARESIALLTNTHRRNIQTEIVPYSHLYQAEDYHQKYYLQSNPPLMKDFRAIYTNIQHFIDSTAAARVNGYMAGYGDAQDVISEIQQLAFELRRRI